MQSVSFHPELHASSNLKNLILTLFTGMKILILPRSSTFLTSEFSIDFENSVLIYVPHDLRFFFDFLENVSFVDFVESESRC